MTVLHLAAKFGHVDVLEVLRGKVPWSMASVKVQKAIPSSIFSLRKPHQSSAMS